jgi:molybdopterin-guanine dinucleotide biosynthesis protein A
MARTSVQPRQSVCCGIALCGGAASRLGGGNKALKSYAGKPLIEHTLGLLFPQCDQIIISANQDLDQIRSYGHPIVSDREKGFPGPLHAIHDATYSTNADQYLILACDMPELKPYHLSSLKAALSEEPLLEAVLYRTSDGLQPGLMIVSNSAIRLLQAHMSTLDGSLKSWLACLTTKVIHEPNANWFKNLNHPIDFL